MTNKLNVDIVASDKTAQGASSAKKTLSGVTKNLNKEINSVLTGKGSFAEFSKKMKAVSRGDDVSKVLGALGKTTAGGNILSLAKGFGEAAEAAEVLAGSMGVLGVTTGGVALGLGAAAAAAYAFSKPFITGAAGAAQLSASLGVTMKDLQAFEGAAKRMGVTKEGADQALAGLGNAAHLALTSPAGGTQRAFFGAAGIDVHQFADMQGRIDITGLMAKVAQAVQAQGNAQAQANLAQSLGVSSALPALRQGPGWLTSNMRSSSAFGYFNETDGARSIQAAQDDVINGQFKDRLFRGARRSVAEHGVMQAMDAVAGGLSGAVGANRSAAPADTAKVLGDLAATPQQISLGPNRSITTTSAMTSLTGPAIAAGLNASLPSVMFGQAVTQKFAPAADKLMTAADTIERMFEQRGLNRYAAVGMTTQAYVESAGTFDPHIHQRGGGPGAGMFQLERARQRDFEARYGHGIDQAIQEEEVDNAVWELLHGGNASTRRAGKKFAGVNSYGDAGEIGSRWYEGPADADGQARYRREQADYAGRSLESTGHVTFDVHLHDHRTTMTMTHKDRKGHIHQSMRSY